MRIVKTRTPVVVLHPVSEQYVTIKRGDEYPDDDPIVKEFGWAFVETPAPVKVTSTPVVEQATREPGEKRPYRRSQ